MKILSCGAGQQSTALALMSCENKISPNTFPLVPVYDAILFCDLGAERKWVYDQVNFLMDICLKVDIPFYILQNKNLKEDYFDNYGKKRVCTIPFWSLDSNGKKGKMIRHCTIDYKIIQMQNFVRWHLLGYEKYQRLKQQDIGAHEFHIGFTAEESNRIFESKHPMFINKFPMVEMGIERKDNYKYVRERWGLQTRASACLFCPFHSNYFYKECKQNCPKDYQIVLDFDALIEDKEPNARIGVPNNQIFISKSRKRIRDLKDEECQDQETFMYKDEIIWNGF